jgi:cysteine desulfurase
MKKIPDQMKVYLDNAATTPLDPQVYEAMQPYLREEFGNPSSTHSFGRTCKSAIEMARKNVADLLHTSPGEIYFTSGGTEADNTTLHGLIRRYNIKHVVTTHLEHHAVLHTLEYLESIGLTRIIYLDPDQEGNIEYDQLAGILKEKKDILVTLMHANNEIGNLIDLYQIGELCKEHNALFHSDTVQTVGRYVIDLDRTNTNAILGSAHKFHGPKGIGFMYVDAKTRIPPYLFGGGQERELRAGTENVYGIVGLAKALTIAYDQLEANRKHQEDLKLRMIKGLKNIIPGVQFNGTSGDVNNSLYSVLSVSLPSSDKNEMILFQLDLKNIAASGGSACGSGALKGSHVINALNTDTDRSTIRFSFSKFNTVEEIDYTLSALKAIFN